MKQKMQKQNGLKQTAILCCIFAALFFMSSPSHAQDTTTGLVGHWKLDETTGTTIADSSGNGNTGSIGTSGGTITYSTGKIGNAVGGTTGVVFLNLGAIPLAAQSYSYSFWFYINPAQRSLGAARLYSRDTGQNFFQINDSDADGIYTYDFSVGGNRTGFHTAPTEIIPEAQWNHAAIVADASNSRFYLNGNLITSVSASSNDPTPANDMTFSVGGGETLDGIFDDIRIYTRALTEGDIATLLDPSQICEGDTDGGKLIYNEDYRVMQYCDGSDWQSMGKGASLLHGQKTSGENYDINAVEFDGTSDYLSANAWSSDSKTVTGSFWYRFRAGSGDLMASQSGAGLSIRRSSSNLIRVSAQNDSGTTILRIESGAGSSPSDQWIHVLFSFDASDPTKRHIYLNDVDEFASAAVYTDDFVNLDGAPFYIGGRDSSNITDTDFADIWLSDEYIDLSIEANRRNFINADGQAVNLGTDGSLPTGAAPDIFLSGDTASWHTNKGTGGGFTENGALTDAASLPPTTTAKKLVGWWKLDETTGTTATDSSGEGNDGTMNGGLDPSTNSVTGSANTALTFDGVDDNINIGNSYTNIINGNMTISAWIKSSTDDRNQMSVLYHNVPTVSRSPWFFVDNGELVFAHGNGVTSYRYYSGVNVTDGTWKHVAFTADNLTYYFYVDGVQVATGAMTENVSVVSPNSYSIGGSASFTNTLWDGELDDVRIYNFALDAAEVAELRAASNTFYNAQGINFDGTARLSRAAPFTGAVDSKLITGSFWFKANTDGTAINIMNSTNGIEIIRNTSANMRVRIYDTAGAIIASEQTTGGLYATSAGWVHTMFAYDAANPGRSRIYTNGVLSASPTSFTDEDFDFSTYTNQGFQQGSDTFQVADVWIDFGTFINLDDPEIRARFITKNNEARYLGANGELVNGTAPEIFMTGDASIWNNNAGTGGSFAITAGALANITGPNSEKQPRYCTSPAQPEGTLIYNTDEHVMQYCDGYTYRPLGPQGDGGGGCSDPSGTAGFLYYNTDFRTIKYCEGDEWIGVGRDPTTDLLAEGLVGHWQLDETTGTTATDSSGNGNDGSMISGLSGTNTATGAIGTALDFDGIDDSIQIPTTASLDLSGTTEFSASLWVDIDDVDTTDTLDTLLIWEDQKDLGGVEPIRIDAMEVTATTWRVQFGATTAVGGLAGLTSTSTFPYTNGFHHVVVTYDGAEMKIYVDGADEGTLPKTGTISTPADGPLNVDWHIGSGEDNVQRFSNGKIDDVRIYNRALSAAEITALYDLANIDPCSLSGVTPGTTCNDGTIYAGLSPDGNVPMFTTPCDEGQTWSGSTCTGSRLAIPWNDGNTSGYVTTSVSSQTTGEANTASLSALDSDSVTAGVQPHQAAQRCADSTHGDHTDWYLPARSEVNRLHTERVAIGNFDQNVGSSSNYWTSSEYHTPTSNARFQSFENGVNVHGDKSTGISIRCVRK